MSLSTLSEELLPKALIVAAAAGAAIYRQTTKPQDLEEPADITDPIEFTDKGRLMTQAELVGEYNNLIQARDILAKTVTTRRSISSVASFLLNWAPGLATMHLRPSEKITMEDLEKIGIEKQGFTPLVDLGAFSLKSLREGTLDANKFKEAGINEVVIMEDRAPHFFLNYSGFNPDQEVPLNRHGNKQDKWTMEDLRKLSETLHEADIRVIIGFWANTEDKDNNPFVKQNWDRLQPLLPMSDDMNVMSFVIDKDGREVTFADYVVAQYKKISRDIEFDGLFLGDGLMGWRSFLDTETRYDFSEKQYLWTDFYRRIKNGITAEDPQNALWAYDCMGNGKTRSRLNGVSMQAITPQIDNYVFQSYGNDAWGSDYMNLPGYDLQRDTDQIKTIPEEMRAKVRYTIGLGDSVEHWWGRKEWISDKHSNVGPHAHKGTLGVWSNEILARLQQH